jgi:hypothetical protein
LLGDQALFDSGAELGYETGAEVAILFPEGYQIPDLLCVLRAVREGSCAPDQSRQECLELFGEVVVAVAKLDMVEDVVQDVEYVQSLPPSRRLTCPRL